MYLDHLVIKSHILDSQIIYQVIFVCFQLPNHHAHPLMSHHQHHQQQHQVKICKSDRSLNSDEGLVFNALSYSV